MSNKQDACFSKELSKWGLQVLGFCHFFPNNCVFQLTCMDK